MKTILALFSHPDDCELWAGGILKKHVDLGDMVIPCFFHQLKDERKEESKKALSILGMTPIFINTKSYEMPDFDSFTKLIDYLPDVIISHWEYDTHLEHKLIFEHSFKYAHYLKRVKNKTPIFLMASTYFQVGSNQNFIPSIIFDITEYIDKKIMAIKCHKSQNPDYLINDVISQNKLLGEQVKTRFAEGFIEYPLFGFRRSALRDDINSLIK